MIICLHCLALVYGELVILYCILYKKKKEILRLSNYKNLFLKLYC
jgi:hypothetical protein